ncbi:MAG TPA: creatininase family protein [Bacillota bacterium]|jgi:creatinine amidohydrolase/Fe(II)-dependent formamide hydrolase-like protein
MARIVEYIRQTLPQLQALDKAKSIALMSVSPIEVHGPHLPVGTDVYISDELQRRYAAEIELRHPDFTLVVLPPLHAGADPLPVGGSIAVPAPVLEGLIVAFAAGLGEQGFRYLLISDNHGGPRHQMAIEAAARTAWKKHRFYVINSFGLEFRMMVQHDQALLTATGLGPGNIGDDPDVHAGTNETSLMLATDPGLIDPGYRNVPPSAPTKGPGVVAGLGRILRALGGRVIGRDLEHLDATLAWTGQKGFTPYMGAPAKASREAGEAMFKARVEVAMGLLERALRGEELRITPMLWGLRILRKLPG